MRDEVTLTLCPLFNPLTPRFLRLIGDFTLSVLPETGPDSTCLDVLNYFQQGRSHILLVSKVRRSSFVQTESTQDLSLC